MIADNGTSTRAPDRTEGGSEVVTIMDTGTRTDPPDRTMGGISATRAVASGTVTVALMDTRGAWSAATIVDTGTRTDPPERTAGAKSDTTTVIAGRKISTPLPRCSSFEIAVRAIARKPSIGHQSEVAKMPAALKMNLKSVVSPASST